MNTIQPPRLIISARDLRRLEALLGRPETAATETAQLLEEEIARAEVREPGDIPPDLVTMHSSVSIVDAATGEEKVVRLVYPHEVGGSPDCVSVLAPVGAALLGLRVNDAIDWPMPGGRVARLRVTAVHYQPEAAGLPE